MRNLVTALLAALVAVTAMAQTNRVYIEDFSIEPDSTVVVPVFFANVVPSRGLQFNLSLPEGLTLTKSRLTQYSKEYAMILTCRYSNRDQCYGVFIYPSGAICFDPDTAAVMELWLTAQPDFSGGEISLWNCYGSTIENKTIAVQGGVAVVTVPESSLIGIPVDKVDAKEEFFNLTGQRVASPDALPVAIQVTTFSNGQRYSRKVAVCN